ncbi:MAG: hypothetical protein JW991_03250 [Candidatus Pacebacteria bacterium]|nr:hypothetical protein [Candidatus Paceibacterota bacterium]
MDQLEQPRPARTEKSSSAFAVMLEALRAQESRLALLGQRDARATRVFQDYHLPGQEFTRQQDGKQVEVVRGLVDPEEYAILVNKYNGGAQLLKIVDEDQKALAEGWKTIGLKGEPPLHSSLEIIVGNINDPKTCYRYKVLDARSTDDSTGVVITVQQNIEHEREGGAFMPFRVSAGKEKPELRGETSVRDTPPLSMAVVSDSGFTDSQRRLMRKDNFPPKLALGRRTGSLIAHQRVPEGMTRFADDVANLEIDLQRDNLWVVAISGDAVEAQCKALKL